MAGRRRVVGPPYGVPQRPPIISPRTVPPAVSTRRTVLKLADITVTETALGKVRDVIFGRAPQGLKLIYANSFDNGNTLYLVGAVGEGPDSSIIPKLDSVAMTNTGLGYWQGPGVTAWIFDGTQVGLQDNVSGLLGYDATWITTGVAFDHLAFVVFKIVWSGSNETRGGGGTAVRTSVPKIDFDVYGYSDVLLNAGTGARGYTDNPVLCTREVMTNTRWGMKFPLTSFNHTTVEAAAARGDTAIFPGIPLAPTATVTGTVGLPFGNIWYQTTGVNGNGVETLMGPMSNVVSPGFHKVDVAVPAADANTVNRYLYRRIDNINQFHRIATIAGNGAAVFTDNVDAADAGWLAAPGPPTIAPWTNKRFSINLVMGQQANGEDWINTLRAYWLGVITWVGGKFEFYVDDALPGGYVRQVFSENRNWGGNKEPANIKPDSFRIGRKDDSELFNQIEIKFNDIQNNYATTSVVISRPEVDAGTAIARRATYELPGIPDSSIAGRLGTNLLNLEWDDASFEWEADRSAIKTAVWDVVSVTANGLIAQDVRVREIEAKGDGYIIRGTEYHDASHSDAIVAQYAPLSAGSFGLNAAYLIPQNIDPATVTFTEVLFTPEPESVESRGLLNFTYPSRPSIEAVEVWASINGGASAHWFDVEATPAMTPPLYEVGTYALTFFTRSRAKRLSSGVVKNVNVFKMTTTAPPDVVNLTLTGGGDPTAIWDVPATIAQNHYGAGSWSQTGLSNYTAAKVNDGDIGTRAFSTVIGTLFTLTFDAGAGNAKDFRYVLLYYNSVNGPSTIGSSGGSATSTFEYSDDGVTWTEVTYRLGTILPPAPASCVKSGWAPPGSHRFWRWRCLQAVFVTDITEVQFGEVTALGQYIDRAEIYDNSTGKLYATIPAASFPTAANPLKLLPIASITVDKANNSVITNVSVKVIVMNAGGNRSGGVSGSPTGFVTGQAAVGHLALVNGNNNDIDVTNFAIQQTLMSVCDISGPTAAFSVSSLKPTYEGKEVLLINSVGQQLTIKDASAGLGTAGNRIVTFTGGDIVLTSPCTALLKYSAAQSAWILLGVRDATIRHNAGFISMVADPAAGDSSDKVPTTRWVQGEAMQRVTGTGGLSAVTASGTDSNRPTGLVTDGSSTTSASYVTMLSITGKGVLRFLSAGVSGGNGTIRVTVDGTVVLTLTCSNTVGQYFARAIVGQVLSFHDGSVPEWDWMAVPGGDGFTFKTSLLIELKHNTGFTSYAAWDYLLY